MRTFTQFMEGQDGFRVTRNGYEFMAWVGKDQVGQAYISPHSNGVWTLDAIDIFDHSEDGGPNYQRQGYGTRLMQEIAKFLRAVGAKTLKSSNEGSGTVQMLDRVFGRQNVQHFHGGKPVSYDHAVHVMDVLYGYTGSEVKIR